MRKIKIGKIAACALLLVSVVTAMLQTTSTSAAQLSSRSLTLQAGAGGNAGSMPGGVVRHLFSFTIPGGGNVGSIKFLYCTTASDTCTMPTGLVTTSATLGAETGATGFSMVNTTNGSPYLTRTPATVTAQAATYRLDTITNPTTTNQTFYVRISTYVSTDTTGGATDTGTVAASTATQIVLSGTMPESLIFCAGGTIGVTSTVPDCSTATAGTVSFNQLFSPADTATATSQLAASTNAGAGYVITVNGPTLTSGSNTIVAMNSATTGVRGISQFGMNLKLNTTGTSNPAVGAEIAPASNGTNFKGQALTGYNTADTFKFTTGDSIADSANGGAGGTDAQIYTVSYIVNVSGGQAAGTYTTTLTYICTPTF
jgi:hypothetical protein